MLGLGRSIPNLQAVNAEVDINIVVATGVYTFRLLPDFIHNRPARGAPDADEIQDVMVEMFGLQTGRDQQRVFAQEGSTSAGS